MKGNMIMYASFMQAFEILDSFIGEDSHEV